ncbi:MAG: glycerol-3-phosphate dehydrogenase/oxidase, partial [Chloroflexota bacterium]
MKRDLFKLESAEFDLIVVGGGIHGAFVAWDAAQRGLSVALVERGDFGSATSANSLKTVHGGLRYLQDFDLGLVQKMIFERKTYLKIAPHLVHTLPFVVPTIKKMTRSYFAMGIALTLNDLIGRKRNDGQVVGKEIPPSRLISKDECLAYLPGMDADKITGGALWYDAQVFNTERFTINVLKSAASEGACLANYVSAEKLLIQNGAVIGAAVKDELRGDRFDIQAKMVVNATGAWIDKLIVDSDHPVPNGIDYPMTVAWNIVTRKFIDRCAAGIFARSKADNKSKLLFVAPWRDYSIAGTVHEAIEGEPDSYNIPQQQIEEFVDDINFNYNDVNLTLDDIQSVHKGFHHVKSVSAKSKRNTKALRKGVVYDHGLNDSIEGLVTIVSVKFTTARSVAERTIDLVCQKLGVTRPCETHFRPIYGGDVENFDDFMTNSLSDLGSLIEKELLYNYGTAYRELLKCAPQLEAGTLNRSDIFRAQIKYSLENEMAVTLSDVLLRRTDIGSGEPPSAEIVHECATIMQRELGWTDGEKVSEIERLEIQLAQRWSGDS